jgi:hypothetical protein
MSGPLDEAVDNPVDGADVTASAGDHETRIADPTPQQVLACPMDGYEAREAGVTTVGGYLLALLRGMWRDQTGFNSKRPFGTSGWAASIAIALMRAGYAELAIQDHWVTPGYDWERVDRLVADAIMYLDGPDEPARRAGEYATAAAAKIATATDRPVDQVVAAIQALTIDQRRLDVIDAARRLVNETEFGPHPSAVQRALLQAVNTLDGSDS